MGSRTPYKIVLTIEFHFYWSINAFILFRQAVDVDLKNTLTLNHDFHDMRNSEIENKTVISVYTGDIP